MRKLKVIQIGIQHEHAPGKMDSLRKMEDTFDIIGYVDDRSFSKGAVYHPTLEYMMDPHKGLRQLTLEEALNYPGLDAVFVEVPNADLLDMAFLCVSKNLPIHLDKPPCEDLCRFKQLLDLCQEKKLPLQMGYMYRVNPAMQFCRKLAKEGVLGTITDVEMDMSHDYGGEPYQHYLSTFKGGVLYNLGCHIIDYFVSLLGVPEKTTSFMKTVPGTLPGVFNNTVAVLEYPDVLATVRVNAVKGGGAFRRRLRVTGTRGTFNLSPLERFDGKELTALLCMSEAAAGYDAGENTIVFPPQKDRYIEQLQEFADIVRGIAEPSYSYHHDYLVHKTLLTVSGVETQK